MSVQVCWGLAGAAAAFATGLLWSVIQHLLRYGLFHAGLHAAWLRSRGPSFGEERAGLSVGTLAATTAILAMAEEASFRGIILPRLRKLTGRWWSAVLICSVLFGLHHISGGFAHIAGTILTSVAFCVVFIRSRSLVGAAVAHFGSNMLLYVFQTWR